MRRWLIASLLACACGTLAAQQPQFRARADLVRLDVRVTNDRGPIRGLAKNDFVVKDNGAEVDAQVEELTDLPLDLVLVASPLASVNLLAADQTSRMAAALSAFLDQVEARDRLAIVLASAPPRRLRRLEFGRPALDLSVFGPGAYAATLDAIVVGLSEFDDVDRRKALILFTTGADFRSTVDMDSIATTIAHSAATFVALGALVPVDQSVAFASRDAFTNMPFETGEARVSGRVFPARVRDLARRAGGLALNLSAEAPADLMVGMFDWLRTQYLVSYPTPAGTGRHAVSISVRRRGARVVARNAYFVN